jgi:hypothetical protein
MESELCTICRYVRSHHREKSTMNLIQNSQKLYTH